MATTSTFLLGSYPGLTAQDLTIETSGPIRETKTVAAGDYYLDDSQAGKSLLSQVAAAILSHSVVSAVELYVGRDRKVHLATTPGVKIEWDDTLLRDLLGWSTDLATSYATSYDAPLISPLLWSPGKTEISDSRLGTQGTPVYDSHVTWGAGTSAPIVTQHNVAYENSFVWRYVANARSWTTSDLGGEYKAFWEYVIRKGWRFKLYRDLTDDPSSTTELSWSGALGPYSIRPGRGDIAYDHVREIANYEAFAKITLPVRLVSDYT